MAKRDYKKELKHLYGPSKKEFSVVDVPPMNFLMIDGHGDPNDNPDFQEGMEALYGMAYTIKFALKPQGIEYVVPPSEGLWWMEDMSEFSLETKDRWQWTLMIMQPDEVTQEIVAAAQGELARKKDPPALSKLRYERYHEGLSVQIMYLGAYADEGPTIARMHEFIRENGYDFNGKHHEIYLGDPRRTAPEKLKTVIRQPVKQLQ
ncbi:MAG: GyrI-like domain-containing protein [Anaerolineales bacterium]